MSRSTISTFKLFELYPEVETARKYLESRLWPKGAICPKCGGSERITPRKSGFYRCNACKVDFTVRTGTIFERSHIPLHKWIYAMYLLVTARKGISSMQLGKEIGIRQASAWFLLHRLREACGNDLVMLRGTVEADEVYLGGKEQNKHMSQRMYGDRGYPTKIAVVGMRERKGRTRAVRVDGVGALSAERIVRNNVEEGSTLHTDELHGYQRRAKTYKHQTINHGADEYSRKGISTNSVEACSQSCVGDFTASTITRARSILSGM